MTPSARPSFIADQYYRWIIVLYGLLLQAISVGTVIYCFALFTLPWLEEFGSSRRALMLTIAFFTIIITNVVTNLVSNVFSTTIVHYTLVFIHHIVINGVKHLMTTTINVTNDIRTLREVGVVSMSWLKLPLLN